MAAPMPRDPPVTRAIFPSSFFDIVFFSFKTASPYCFYLPCRLSMTGAFAITLRITQNTSLDSITSYW
jgi:hypothetical protein